MAESTLLASLFRDAGLEYGPVGDGTIFVTFKGNQSERIHVQAGVAKGRIAYFSVMLPPMITGWEKIVMRNLLRVSGSALYTKAMVTEQGDFVLVTELPTKFLTAGITRGLVRALAKIGDVRSEQLHDWENWRTRLMDAVRLLGGEIRVDVENANHTIPILAKEAGWDCAMEPDQSWSLRWPLGPKGHPRFHAALLIRTFHVGISCSAPIGGNACPPLIANHARRLLELNREFAVVKIAIPEHDSEISVRYDVPSVMPDLLATVDSEMGVLFVTLMRTMQGGGS
jgi:hypothetical protein